MASLYTRPLSVLVARIGGRAVYIRGGCLMVASGSLLPDATMHPRDVAAVQLRLPTFWRNNPQLWFAQVEATFNLQHISSEISRFRHLLCNLSPEVAQEVADVIAAPLNDAAYQRLKQSILDRTTTSESARLKHLLTSEELCDRRPSQLLNSMRQLLQSSDVDSNRALLREVFLQRLPQSTRLVLAAAGDLTLDRLAQIESTMRLLLRSPHYLQHQNHP
ncbi:hypothetical protein HPB50_008794 [Hyalomma asiaticum]|uniref:Uncharacterized protein n=1 Tax=Hyalomma asiaticum TaxID=266040 RepID=A0ACB7TKX2_HYAAI|nr:hypothetical protein HPB50_008794 [Hyalomma asiaticum]